MKRSNLSHHSDPKRKRDKISDSESARDSPLSDHEVASSKCNSFSSPQSNSKARNGLSRELAVEIYKKRPETMGFKKSRRGTMVGCEAVAVEFGVTPKTIRDIWRGRTWSEATGHPQSDNDSRYGLRTIPLCSQTNDARTRGLKKSE